MSQQPIERNPRNVYLKGEMSDRPASPDRSPLNQPIAHSLIGFAPFRTQQLTQQLIDRLDKEVAR